MQESLHAASQELVEDQILAEQIVQAAIKAANHTLDGSEVAPFVPAEDPNTLLDFGRPVETPKFNQAPDKDKQWRLRKVYKRKNIPVNK